MEPNRAAHAVSDEVRARDVECLEQFRRIPGHILVRQRPNDVARVTVALHLYRHHLEVVGKPG